MSKYVVLFIVHVAFLQFNSYAILTSSHKCVALLTSSASVFNASGEVGEEDARRALLEFRDTFGDIFSFPPKAQKELLKDIQVTDKSSFSKKRRVLDAIDEHVFYDGKKGRVFRALLQESQIKEFLIENYQLHEMMSGEYTRAMLSPLFYEVNELSGEVEKDVNLELVANVIGAVAFIELLRGGFVGDYNTLQASIGGLGLMIGHQVFYMGSYAKEIILQSTSRQRKKILKLFEDIDDFMERKDQSWAFHSFTFKLPDGHFFEDYGFMNNSTLYRMAQYDRMPVLHQDRAEGEDGREYKDLLVTYQLQVLLQRKAPGAKPTMVLMITEVEN